MIRRPPRSTLFPSRRSSDLDSANLGYRLGGELPEEFAAFVRSEEQKWSKVIKDANIKRSEENTSQLQSHLNLVCLLLLEKKKKTQPLTTLDSQTRKDSPYDI